MSNMTKLFLPQQMPRQKIAMVAKIKKNAENGQSSKLAL
jgi:hypothetical protein